MPRNSCQRLPTEETDISGSYRPTIFTSVAFDDTGLLRGNAFSNFQDARVGWSTNAAMDQSTHLASRSVRHDFQTVVQNALDEALPDVRGSVDPSQEPSTSNTLYAAAIRRANEYAFAAVRQKYSTGPMSNGIHWDSVAHWSLDSGLMDAVRSNLGLSSRRPWGTSASERPESSRASQAAADGTRFSPSGSGIGLPHSESSAGAAIPFTPSFDDHTLHDGTLAASLATMNVIGPLVETRTAHRRNIEEWLSGGAGWRPSGLDDHDAVRLRGLLLDDEEDENASVTTIFTESTGEPESGPIHRPPHPVQSAEVEATLSRLLGTSVELPRH